MDGEPSLLVSARFLAEVIVSAGFEALAGWPKLIRALLGMGEDKSPAECVAMLRNKWSAELEQLPAEERAEYLEARAQQRAQRRPAAAAAGEPHNVSAAAQEQGASGAVAKATGSD